jgi:hypothetical protein
MGKNNHDIQIGRRVNPVAKLSFWSGLLSIPSSIFLLGIPLGIIAFFTGGSVMNRNKNTVSDDVDWGKAKLGRLFGCTGILDF